MKTITKITSIGLAVIHLNACGQNSSKMLSSKEILSAACKEVKFTDKQVNYHTGIQVGGCAFEFFINDFPVVQYYGAGNGALNTSAPINPYILRTGKQTWKLIIYPAYLNGVQTQYLSEGVETNIELKALKFREDGVDNVSNPYFLIETPKKKNQRGEIVYADAGKIKMVYEGTFQAAIPYELTGWDKSVDLKRGDSNALKNEVVDYYQHFADLIKRKDLDEIAQRTVNKEKEIAQALFYSQEDCADNIQEFLDTYEKNDLDVQKLENLKIAFYAEGKVVCLERTDLPGKSPLVAFYKDKDNKKKYRMFFCYLHRPNPGSKLEIIR